MSGNMHEYIRCIYFLYITYNDLNLIQIQFEFTFEKNKVRICSLSILIKF